MAATILTCLLPWWYIMRKSRPLEYVDSNFYNAIYINNKRLLCFDGVKSDSAFTRIDFSHNNILHSPVIRTDSRFLKDYISKNIKYIERKRNELSSAQNELEYYINVHNVQDEGYDIVSRHYEKTGTAIARLDSFNCVLKRIQASDNISLQHIAKYKLNTLSQSSSTFYESMGGIWQNGLWLRMAKNGRGISTYKCSGKIFGEWNGDTLSNGIIITDNGVYEGSINKYGIPEGHGIFHSSSSTDWYEGHWENGLRNGFGVMSTPHKLMAGEWKNDIYKGERITYTSERIYGIDISRHQHVKGKKIYPIDWKKLRITHLGSSRKTIKGDVDYPVSFIYIKSTEGTSIKNRFYLSDYQQARKHGIRCGTYHFFSLRSSPQSQAAYFLKHSRINKGDLPPVLDVEPTQQQIANNGGPDALFSKIRIWMNIVERRTGIKPILYVNQLFINRYLNYAPDIKQNYDIWIARYGEYKPDVRLVYWQLCQDGRVKGIHGDVDINIFNGFQEQFDKFSK
ncbi:GH25 family lysozyme [Xylanibacter muris]|nr:GH25 family lysozyme [Xylanibacter muris]